MTILQADHLGMCFGVRDALALAQSLADSRPVTVLGDLVHNEAVLEQLRNRGVRFAKALNAVQTSAVMVTAHGASDQFHRAIEKNGWDITDATCPLVHHAHRSLATLVRKGCHPVVIGKAGHVEVRGLIEDHPDGDVVLSEADIDQLKFREKFGVVSQTTQPIQRVRQLVAYFRQRFPRSEIIFRDTVCQPTKQRQTAAENLANRCTVVVVIGGEHSNNTHELVTTCQKFCSRVFHVQTAAKLEPGWFLESDVVGITAGTSTPDDVIAGVSEWLSRLTWPRSSNVEMNTDFKSHLPAKLAPANSPA